ncbi:MAG: phosphoribosyl-ATP diphosphatase [Rhodospirillaceae bacterium]
MSDDKPVIERLYATIAARKSADPSSSYTAKLLADGRPRIAKKLGEEAVEVCVAALSGGRDEVIAESGDLLYHLLVLWAEQGIAPDEVWNELAGRFGTSGIDEKKSRQGKD